MTIKESELALFCPKQGNKIEGVVLNGVRILGIFCPKKGQGFKPSAAHLYPNIGRLLPTKRGGGGVGLLKKLSN